MLRYRRREGSRYSRCPPESLRAALTCGDTVPSRQRHPDHSYSQGSLYGIMAHELILWVGATGVSNGASQSLEVILVPPSDILSGSKLAIARSKPRFRLNPSII